MDGYVIIGTQLDTKQLEADIKNAKKELSQFQKEEEKLLKEKGKVELQLTAYDEEKAKIKANTDELLKKAETEAQVTNLLNMENLELDKLTQKYSKQFGALDEVNDKLKDNQLQQGLINGKIDEANTKLSQAKGYENVANQIGKIKDKTSDVVKQVGRWALAIFSVRSAYMFIRQMSSTLAQYNKEYGANLEYIRYALAQMIAPVLQFLVNLAFKLLTYINYIAQAWFGVNLFSNASVKNFNKMAGSAKSIKESLQTAGFDEMNVLSDTSSSSGGAGGGVPSFDLQNPEDVPIPSWLQWIVDNKDLVIAGLAGIAGGLIAVHLGLGLIKSLGIGILVAGIVMIIQDVIDLINDPSWQNFVALLGSIAIAIGGIMLIMGNWWGLLVALVGLAVKLIAENWDTVTQILGKVGGWIYDNIISPVAEFFTNLWNKIVEGVTNAVDKVKKIFTAVKTFFQEIINKIISMFVTIGTKVGDGISKAFKTIINAVFEGVERILNSPINAINGLINVINAVPRNKFRHVTYFYITKNAIKSRWYSKFTKQRSANRWCVCWRSRCRRCNSFNR